VRYNIDKLTELLLAFSESMSAFKEAVDKARSAHLLADKKPLSTYSKEELSIYKQKIKTLDEQIALNPELPREEKDKIRVKIFKLQAKLKEGFVLKSGDIRNNIAELESQLNRPGELRREKAQLEEDFLETAKMKIPELLDAWKSANAEYEKKAETGSKLIMLAFYQKNIDKLEKREYRFIDDVFTVVEPQLEEESFRPASNMKKQNGTVNFEAAYKQFAIAKSAYDHENPGEKFEDLAAKDMDAMIKKFNSAKKAAL